MTEPPTAAGRPARTTTVRPARIAPKGLPPDGLTHLSDTHRANLFDGTFLLPTAVLLDEPLRHNIALMADHCADHGVLLAPHGKTTMSPEIIARQIEAGAWAITVATSWQAGAVVAMGVRRVLVANQVVDPASVHHLDTLLLTHPGLELLTYVDSEDGLVLLEHGLSPGAALRLGVLLELGVPEGRTGLRDDTAALALAARIAAGPLRLAGVAGFEGIIDGGDLDATLVLVDALLSRMATTARRLRAEGLLDADVPIVTAGGSAYFDRVIAALPDALRGTGYRVVLRSGCYVTHDSGGYERLSPLAGRLRTGARLRPALEVWAPVLSRPEPDRIIVGLGKRDISTDAGFPVPLRVRTGTGPPTAPPPDWRVVAVNDQHAYLDVPSDTPARVGDLVGFGISHPCTTFDKWQVMPLVDGDYGVIGRVHTSF